MLECSGVEPSGTEAAGILVLQLKQPPPVTEHGIAGGR